jgi:hypothetical protein
MEGSHPPLVSAAPAHVRSAPRRNAGAPCSRSCSLSRQKVVCAATCGSEGWYAGHKVSLLLRYTLFNKHRDGFPLDYLVIDYSQGNQLRVESGWAHARYCFMGSDGAIVGCGQWRRARSLRRRLPGLLLCMASAAATRGVRRRVGSVAPDALPRRRVSPTTCAKTPRVGTCARLATDWTGLARPCLQGNRGWDSTN